MKHTISVLVENNAGVLARVSGLFARRGYNIHSLAVGVTQDPTLSRITIVADGSEQIIDQIEKQVNKLVDVVTVRSTPAEALLSRELVLAKIGCTPQQRPAVISVADVTGAKISDVSPTTVTLEISGDTRSIAAFEELVAPFGVIEMARTGVIAMQTGALSLNQ
jgi:acetolactate synthase-1/3 small subunit